MQEQGVTLVTAAVALRKTYQQTLNDVLTGRIEGWQDDTRKWWVSRESLVHLIEHGTSGVE